MSEYTGMERRAQEEHWHLDKKVPITLIITLLAYGVAGLWAFADVKKDVEVLKIQVTQQRDRDDRQDKTTAEAFTQLYNQLNKMDSKLDRLVEKKQ